MSVRNESNNLFEISSMEKVAKCLPCGVIVGCLPIGANSIANLINWYWSQFLGGYYAKDLSHRHWKCGELDKTLGEIVVGLLLHLDVGHLVGEGDRRAGAGHDQAWWGPGGDLPQTSVLFQDPRGKWQSLFRVIWGWERFSVMSTKKNNKHFVLIQEIQSCMTVSMKKRSLLVTWGGKKTWSCEGTPAWCLRPFVVFDRSLQPSDLRPSSTSQPINVVIFAFCRRLPNRCYPRLTAKHKVSTYAF